MEGLAVVGLFIGGVWLRCLSLLTGSEHGDF